MNCLCQINLGLRPCISRCLYFSPSCCHAPPPTMFFSSTTLAQSHISINFFLLSRSYLKGTVSRQSLKMASTWTLFFLYSSNGHDYLYYYRTIFCRKLGQDFETKWNVAKVFNEMFKCLLFNAMFIVNYSILRGNTVTGVFYGSAGLKHPNYTEVTTNQCHFTRPQRDQEFSIPGIRDRILQNPGVPGFFRTGLAWNLNPRNFTQIV